MKAGFLALALSALSFTAFTQVAHADDATWAQQNVSISYMSQYSFYDCMYAQGRVEDILTQLGAHDISTTCTGGLPDMTFVHVQASFTSAQAGGVEAASFQPVSIATTDECDFNETILRDVTPAFTINNAKLSSNCWDANGDVNFSGDVLK